MFLNYEFFFSRFFSSNLLDFCRDELFSELEKILRAGFISESDTPYQSTLTLTKTPSKSLATGGVMMMEIIDKTYKILLLCITGNAKNSKLIHSHIQNGIFLFFFLSIILFFVL